jgi:hypothetical protein
MIKGDPMPPRTPEDVYKEKLQDRVRREKNNPTLVIDFKNGNLNQHMADDGQAQVVVLLATSDSADEFGKVLNEDGKKTIRQSITRNTAYADAIGVMDTAVSEGSVPKEPA